jgi:hypothetical protein
MTAGGPQAEQSKRVPPCDAPGYSPSGIAAVLRI